MNVYSSMLAVSPGQLILHYVFHLHIIVYTSTGGADRSVKLWELDTKLCLHEYRGHSDVVRDVKVASGDIFLSAANDW